MDNEQDLETISETENFFVWRSQEEEEGYTYHVELGGITLHMISEEWDEFVLLIKSVT